MAGNYPDPPNPRMAYDRDGTQVYSISGSNPTALAAGTVTALNGENGQYNVNPFESIFVGWVFPEPRTLTNWYIAVYGSGSAGKNFQYSTDTTNLIDGTWTMINTSPLRHNTAGSGDVKPAYRELANIGSPGGGPIANIKGLKLEGSGGGAYTNRLKHVHLYGYPTTLGGDRLEFWHPTLDQRLSVTPAHFDWGNRPRDTTATKQVRVKNSSATLTANTITVGIEAITDASPTKVSQHTFSIGGGAFASTVSIASLAPGQISGVIDVKQTLTASAALSLWSQRLYANAASWT